METLPNFAVPVDDREKIKESEKKDKCFVFVRELKEKTTIRNLKVTPFIIN